jgi:membrane protein
MSGPLITGIATTGAPLPALPPPAPPADDREATRSDGVGGSGARAVPERWVAVLRRTVEGFVADHGQDDAAALTYYGVLAMFPAFIALVALLGVVGRESTVTTLVDIVQQIGSEQAAEAFRGPAESAVLAAALTMTGPVAFEVGDVIGLGSTAVWIWQIAKWPAMLIVFAPIVALLHGATPDVPARRLRLVSPGAGLAVVVWLVASAGFAVYVANLGSYGATYGSLGGVIVLILWLWITNIALLLGARLDAEIARAAAGIAAPEPS